MAEEHFVVVGNGPAGNQAALTLKEKVPGAHVTLISRDRESCYRPHLLPGFIAGEIPEASLYVCPTEEYKDKGVKLRTGQKMVRLSLADKGVILDHKEIVRYTGLILAVGGKPRIPEPLLIFQDLLLTLKTPEDAKTWVRRLSRADSVLVMGGDLTSFALTKALLKMNRKVYFVFDEEAFWPMKYDRVVVEEAAHHLSQQGVEVLLDRRPKSIARVSSHACEVELNEDKIKVGIIGAFFGLVPDVRSVAGSGLRIDRGILVDEFLNTGVEEVYAAGDCAQIYHPQIHDYWISIGHDNAVRLGRTAAINLLGGRIEAEAAAESIFEVQGIKVNTSWWTQF